MKEITFEMATELGLIPRPKNRYLTLHFLFESRYAYEKRCESGENGFKAEMARIKKQYQTVKFRGQTLKVI